MQTTPRRKAKKVINIVLRTLFLGVVSLIVGVSIYSWNAKTFLGNSLPMPFGHGVAVVLSGSMEPELSVDDLVVVKKTNDYQIGDVVVYQTYNEDYRSYSLTIHRIISIDGDTVITKGDANNGEDQPITMDDIKGELLFAVPFAGTVADMFRSPIVIIIVVILAFLVLELSYKREKKNKDTDLDKIRAQIEELKKQTESSDSLYVENLKLDIENISKNYETTEEGGSPDEKE